MKMILRNGEKEELKPFERALNDIAMVLTILVFAGVASYLMYCLATAQIGLR